LTEAVLFEKTSEKWSVAENLQHLILSTKTTNLAFLLPAFLLRIVAGKPNRSSISFDDLLEKYHHKIELGAQASERYIPKALIIKEGKEILLSNWQKVNNKFLYALKNNTTETKLDDYIVPHPLLGKITLRELCYFTIFHTSHHIETINNIVQQKHPN
jgi:hypothetical protein